MKIFVNGSRNVEQDLPKKICDRINEYLERGDEVLVSGNSGSNYIFFRRQKV